MPQQTNEVLVELFALRNACGHHLHELSKTFPGDRPGGAIGAFGMCFNHITLTTEVCNWYYAHWGTLDPSSFADLNKTVKENASRIVEQTKSNFVLSLSALEFCAKRWAKANPEVLYMDFNRRQYLTGVIGKSHAIGVIDAARHEQWQGLIKIRNTMIHNNAIADENLDVDFGSGFAVQMREGQEIQGTLLIFIRLTRWAIDAYADWCAAILPRIKNEA